MRLAQHRQGRRAAHVHLSRLAPANWREHDIRIAMSTLETLLRKLGGSMFRLSSDDLIVALKDASAANIGDYLGKPGSLFSEDPLFDAQTGLFCAVVTIKTRSILASRPASPCSRGGIWTVCWRLADSPPGHY